jgi:hypothetical protein
MMTPDIPRRSSGASRRRGITMIEMIVLMTGVAAMLGLCAVLLQLLMKLDADSRSRFTGATAAARLAEQFRHDVHRAHSAHLVKGQAGASRPVGLKLEPGGDRSIEYQANGDGLVQRLESRQGSNPRRERYEIPHSGPVKLSLADEKGHIFATLAVDRDVATDESNPPRAFEVTALLGKNQDRVSDAVRPAGGKP